MAILKRVLAASLLAVAAGCEGVDDPFEVQGGHIEVFAVLRAGSDTAAVMVRDVSPPRPRPVRLPGSVVHLIADGDTILLPEAPPGLPDCARPENLEVPEVGAYEGCHTALLPEPIRPGATYGLLAVLPTGDTVRGSTTVPDVPVFVAPESGLVIRPLTARNLPEDTLVPYPSATITVEWLPVSGASRLEASIHAPTPYRNGAVLPDAFCRVENGALPVRRPETTTTVDLWAYWTLCTSNGVRVAWDSLPGRIQLTAYDSAAARYIELLLEEDATIKKPYAAIGLSGALGLFGSVATARRDLIILPDSDEPGGALPAMNGMASPPPPALQ